MIPGSTIIRDVKIKGTLEFSENLFLDCQFDGNIIANGNLTIGEHAKVHGEINADKVTLFGEVTGDIIVKESCHIKASATMIGDIKAQRLEIAEGAVFHGYADIPFKHSLEVDLPEMEAQLECLSDKNADKAGKPEKEKESKTKETTTGKNSDSDSASKVETKVTEAPELNLSGDPKLAPKMLNPETTAKDSKPIDKLAS